MILKTPLLKNSLKILLLGSGELGKELVIEAQRLGIECIAVILTPMAAIMLLIAIVFITGRVEQPVESLILKKRTII